MMTLPTTSPMYRLMTCCPMPGNCRGLVLPSRKNCDKAAAIHLLPPAQNSKHINLRYCGQKGAEGGKESPGRGRGRGGRGVQRRMGCWNHPRLGVVTAYRPC